jgi:hypothetical protein
MRKGFIIYEEMRKYFPIYEEAVSHIVYEENLIFFFISAAGWKYREQQESHYIFVYMCFFSMVFKTPACDIGT